MKNAKFYGWLFLVLSFVHLLVYIVSDEVAHVTIAMVFGVGAAIADMFSDLHRKGRG